MGDEDGSGLGVVLQVDDYGVDDQQSKPREEVEAEENDVGCGGRAEREGEGVHPWGDCHTIGDEEEEDSW